jgi:hypothetical protein
MSLLVISADEDELVPHAFIAVTEPFNLEPQL